MHSILPYEKHNFHQSILNQIAKAFSTTPDLAGTIHGQRKIHQGCYGRRTALFPSTKCGGAIPLESQLELAHAVCLEQDQRVKNYRTQALKISLSQTSCCYPDFLIQTIDDTFEIHEIKPSISNLSEQEIDRFKRLSDQLQPIGIVFRLIDQHNLPTHLSLQQLMHWYQRGHSRTWNQFEINLATEALKQHKYSHIEQLYGALKRESLDPLIGDYLLFHGIVSLKQSQQSDLVGAK